MTQAASASYNTTIVKEEIHLSPEAEVQMANLMQGAEDGVEAIRVFVSGGGCGGMTYGMTYAESATAMDKVLEGEGYKLVVDAVALGYLKGCSIEYTQDGLNTSFVFKNVFQSVGGSGACGGCGGAGF